MKNKALYIIILVLCFAFVAMLEYAVPKPINWKRTYSKEDKIPYGSYLLFELLPQIFTKATINTNYKTLYEVFETDGEQDLGEFAYFFINESFSPTKSETATMLEMAEAGATFFIASNDFGGDFSDTLDLKTISYDFEWQKNEEKNTDSVEIYLSNPKMPNQNFYFKKNAVAYSHFNSVNFENLLRHTAESKIKILGTNEQKKPNFIFFPYGSGGFYLHCNPLIFTNYNLLSNQNNQYISSAFSYINKRNIIWDEYYKVGRNESESPMRFVLQHESLKYAWWLLLVSVILFIAFRSKRTQRIIPILRPPQNTSLAFTETVGLLYFQRRDDADLAKKKVIYFFEFIRTHFYMNTSEINAEFVENLAAKSGYDHNKLKRLFGLIADIQKYQTLSETLLHEINKFIEEFYDFVQVK